MKNSVNQSRKLIATSPTSRWQLGQRACTGGADSDLEIVRVPKTG